MSIPFKTYNDDATALGETVKSGELTSSELIEIAINKAEQLNPDLNMINYFSKDYARAMAIQMPTDDNRPFAGVPTLLKDLGHNIKGMPATSGAKLLKDHTATTTANFTQNVLDMGLVPIGRSNVPEFGLKFISDSKCFGTVRNPNQIDRHAGGSSGGAAAAVKAGVVPIATASDGGGSIRIPASFTGLIGLKPSRGRMATGPGKWRTWGGAPVNFMLTRSMRDTATALIDLQHHYTPMPFYLPQLKWTDIERAVHQVKSLRIAYRTNSPFKTPVTDDAVQAVLKTVKLLQDHGFHVEHVEPELDYHRLVRGYYQMNGIETASTLIDIGEKRRNAVSPQDVEIQTWAMAQYGLQLPGYLYPRILDDWDHAMAIMDQFHQTYDILIEPATAEVAPLIDEPLYSEQTLQAMQQIDQMSVQDQEDIVYVAFEKGLKASPFAMIYNLTGQPGISLPVHLNAAGLPIGVHLAANKGRDDLLIAMGHFLEQLDAIHTETVAIKEKDVNR